MKASLCVSWAIMIGPAKCSALEPYQTWAKTESHRTWGYQPTVTPLTPTQCAPARSSGPSAWKPTVPPASENSPHCELPSVQLQNLQKHCIYLSKPYMVHKLKTRDLSWLYSLPCHCAILCSLKSYRVWWDWIFWQCGEHSNAGVLRIRYLGNQPTHLFYLATHPITHWSFSDFVTKKRGYSYYGTGSNSGCNK